MKILLLFVGLILGQVSFSQEIRKVKIEQLVQFIDTSSCPLIVNFWATWCKPCVHEIPWFEKNLKTTEAKNVQLILVSLDFAGNYPNGILQFAKQQGYTSQIIFLDELNVDRFCPPVDKSWDGAIPVSLFVNNKKHYRKFYNQQLPEPQFKMALDELLR